MIRGTMTVLTSILVMLILAGCASSPERELSQKVPMYAALPNGHDPLNPSRLAPMYVAATSGVEGNLARHLERQRGHALNMLSLSGGGQNGARRTGSRGLGLLPSTTRSPSRIIPGSTRSRSR